MYNHHHLIAFGRGTPYGPELSLLLRRQVSQPKRPKRSRLQLAPVELRRLQRVRADHRPRPRPRADDGDVLRRRRRFPFNASAARQKMVAVLEVMPDSAEHARRSFGGTKQLAFFRGATMAIKNAVSVGAEDFRFPEQHLKTVVPSRLLPLMTEIQALRAREDKYDAKMANWGCLVPLALSVPALALAVYLSDHWHWRYALAACAAGWIVHRGLVTRHRLALQLDRETAFQGIMRTEQGKLLCV